MIEFNVTRACIVIMFLFSITLVRVIYEWIDEDMVQILMGHRGGERQFYSLYLEDVRMLVLSGGDIHVGGCSFIAFGAELWRCIPGSSFFC